MTSEFEVIDGQSSEAASVAPNRGFNSLSSHHLKPAQCHPNVTTIPIRNGFLVLIDAADLPLVAGYRWNELRTKQSVYAASSTGVLMHRLLLGLSGDSGLECDHRDGNGLHNCRHNLLATTRSDNLQNRRPYGKSGFKGVYRDQYNLWRAQIQHKKVCYYLGLFSTVEAAALAYDAKALELYGPTARLNFPDRRAA